MKKISTEGIINSKLNNTILVCKEKEIKGIKGVEVSIKVNKKRELDNDIEICSFEIDTRNINNLDINEMIKLSKTNPKLYCEKLILSQFGNSPILEENRGTSYIMPNRFQRFYENCISFENKSYQVYFPDLSIKYFSNLINKLSLKRKKDSLKYAKDMINRGKVRNLKLSLFEGFNFKHSNYCYYDKNDEGRHLNPSHALYYSICLDEDGNFNKQDLENMKEILELFAESYDGLRHARWDSDDLVAYGKSGGSLLIEGHKKEPYFLDQVCKLTKKKKGD